ncbi:unnamed protein product [Cunninghamella echinulata]
MLNALSNCSIEISTNLTILVIDKIHKYINLLHIIIKYLASKNQKLSNKLKSQKENSTEMRREIDMKVEIGNTMHEQSQSQLRVKIERVKMENEVLKNILTITNDEREEELCRIKKDHGTIKRT